jgi:hypothetical protein
VKTKKNGYDLEGIMMGECPLCNGFYSYSYICTSCMATMIDSGRYSDFFDDYSAYMEIDHLKLEDGFPTDEKIGECPHVFICPNCNHSEVIMIKE